jgi:hypothetical protein
MEFGNLGKRCTRMKSVMTKHGRQQRCAEFGDVGDVGDPDFGDFGDGGRGSVSGPLIGGGVTQVTTIAVKMLAKNKPGLAKWGASIGLLVGGGLSAALAFKRSTRSIGIPALLTSALIALPRQLEDLMASKASLKGAEEELYGLGEETESMDGAPPIQLLDSGGGTGVLGVITPEQELGVITPEQDLGNGDEGQTDGAGNGVELLGGFGSNFMSIQ